MQGAKQPKNHQRTLALLFIATGALFGLYGTGIGALMLAALSGFSIPFAYSSSFANRYARSNDLFFLFLLEVENFLFPRLKVKKGKPKPFATFVYILEL